MAIQDIGTIGAWTPSRLDKHIANLFDQRNQIAKTSISTDAHFIHNSVTFTNGDDRSADTYLTRPSTGVLAINGIPIVTGSISSGVTSWNSRTGVVVPAGGDYAVGQVTGAAPLASPALTGVPTAPTPLTADNSTTIATTAYVKAQGYLTSNAVTSVFTRTGAVVATSGDYSVAQVTGAAPLASPTFTGVPLSTTPATADNSTKIATTAYVQAQGYVTAATAPVTSVFGRTGAVVAASADYTAAQVTNAADKASGSQQAFTAEVSAPDHLATGLTGATAASRYAGATASGSPASGTFATGDYVIDQTGFIWVCTVAGSPGTWASVAGTGGVSSVFGRTGAVIAASGDYTAAQVTNAADKASASAQIFTGSVSTGPTSTAVGGSGGVWLQAGSPGYVISIGAAATGGFYSGYTGDTQWRLNVNHDGLMSWGSGTAVADTSLGRSAGVPPSAGQVGLVTQQAFYSTNTTGGFVYAAAANNSAFLSFLTAADANPAFKIFTQGAFEWGPGGASALDLELARVTSSPSGTGTFLELLVGSGFGYGTGTGGVVTQATSFSTGVTLNKPSGKITLFTSAISTGLATQFTVTCSPCGIDDTVVLSGDNLPGVQITASVAAGSFVISWYAPASLISATRKINFAVIKGAVA